MKNQSTLHYRSLQLILTPSQKTIRHLTKPARKKVSPRKASKRIAPLDLSHARVMAFSPAGSERERKKKIAANGSSRRHNSAATSIRSFTGFAGTVLYRKTPVVFR